MARIGLYPGTFDPMTNGHIDVIRRSLGLVDHLIVAIGINASKVPLLSLEERFALIEKEAAPTAKKLGAKISTASFSGLVVDAADKFGATVIIRGLRGAVDFEYETQMVGMNRVMNPKVETVFPDVAAIAQNRPGIAQANRAEGQEGQRRAQAEQRVQRERPRCHQAQNRGAGADRHGV